MTQGMGNMARTGLTGAAATRLLEGTMSGEHMSGKTFKNVPGFAHGSTEGLFIFAVHDDCHTKMAGWKVDSEENDTLKHVDGRCHLNQLLPIDAQSISDTWDSAGGGNPGTISGKTHKEYTVSDIKDVQTGLYPVLEARALALPAPASIVNKAGPSISDPCRMPRCREFLDSLQLKSTYFDPEYDRCFCQICTSVAQIPDVLEGDSKHGSPYEVPKGWCGFGLKVPPRAFELEVFEEWAVSFHGCPSDVISSILREGQLLMPGDTLVDGSTLANRLTGGGAQRIGIYTSPSINYSEGDRVSCFFTIINHNHESIRLPASTTLGDRVRSLIEHNKVTKGDIGTVLGPCTSADADKADRILVDFGGEKGRVNLLKTEVDREPLA
eukprot:Tamp_09718.p1 GENE.Tamp_09718~~Tamp_09718.p1  ORF type:complete len:382 (-),score=33.40 Tamp_09718:573-1718(-)